jgi:hypothetical protein
MNKDKAKIREILNKKPQIYAYIPLIYLQDDECPHRIKTELKAFITSEAITEHIQITMIRLYGRSVDFSISFNIKDNITEETFIYIANKIKAYFTKLRGLTETAKDISIFYKEEGILKYKVLKVYIPILEGSGKRPQFITEDGADIDI